VDLRTTPLRIIGCGNFDRGDDAAGLLVARRLRALGVETPAIEVMEINGESFSLMDCWTGSEEVILVDATAPSGSPGRVRAWNVHTHALPADFSPCSTHAFGVREAVQLARVVNRLPRTLLICGIEGKQFCLGAAISPEVECAVAFVTERLSTRVSNSSLEAPQNLFFSAEPPDSTR
jgi:hydrogenase maturation protease